MGDVIHLIPIQKRQPRSDVMISAAADISQLDYLRCAAELAMRHIEVTGQPLPAPTRARLFRAVAIVRGQPEVSG